MLFSCSHCQAVDWSLVEEWRLPESVGRQYAALDGDHSPMHLYLWTAKLSGFKKVVANVHLLVARAEATLAGLRGASLLPCCNAFRDNDVATHLWDAFFANSLLQARHKHAAIEGLPDDAMQRVTPAVGCAAC